MNFNTELAQQLLDSPDKFPVSFDPAWVWLGFKQKDSAMESFLDCGFVENEDYYYLATTEVEGNATDSILLTIECLMLWGMAAGTPEGKRIRKCFLECKKLAQQPISNFVEVSATVPTKEQLAYLKSREWEKTEMINFQAPAKKIKKGVGYRRAVDIVRELTEAAQCDVISW